MEDLGTHNHVYNITFGDLENPTARAPPQATPTEVNFAAHEGNGSFQFPTHKTTNTTDQSVSTSVRIICGMYDNGVYLE